MAVPILLSLPPSLPLLLLLCISFTTIPAFILIFASRRRNHHNQFKLPTHQQPSPEAGTTAINPASSSSRSPPPAFPIAAAKNTGREVGKKGGDDGRRKNKGKKKMHEEQQSSVGRNRESWEEEKARLLADIASATAGENSGVAKKERNGPLFKTLSSSVQKKFKEQHDRYLKRKEANSLTASQAYEFVNCLGEVRKDLTERSEQIQRRYAFKRALLIKPNNSNIDRISHEICKMEAENSRMLEDAEAYNVIQDEFKLTPAYNNLVEVCGRIKDANTEEIRDDDISFEELLAIEKKDSKFW